MPANVAPSRVCAPALPRVARTRNTLTSGVTAVHSHIRCLPPRPAVEGVPPISGPPGPDPRQLGPLMASRGGIPPRQRRPALRTRLGLDLHEVVDLLHRQQRAPVPRMPPLPARRTP